MLQRTQKQHKLCNQDSNTIPSSDSVKDKPIVSRVTDNLTNDNMKQTKISSENDSCPSNKDNDIKNS
ncbi:hypothetical protein A3Q56_05814 [Intoshia linei]|uniref:Uncharacterized protein n=1 Tax=Intoshia linei TaxID=1819745 RepID=A0A177AWV2_9BILA|nr:hypothetical protein A3Q56_05814 [Intoshia linei]